MSESIAQSKYTAKKRNEMKRNETSTAATKMRKNDKKAQISMNGEAHGPNVT